VHLLTIVSSRHYLYTIHTSYLEVSSYLLTFVGYALRVTTEREMTASYSSSILAIAAVLQSLKFLYFLRPFRSTGPLVRMVFFILSEVRTFIFILMVVIFGFAQGFYLISFRDSLVEAPSANVDLFGAIDKALLYT
jgi:hypothetical protein